MFSSSLLRVAAAAAPSAAAAYVIDFYGLQLSDNGKKVRSQVSQFSHSSSPTPSPTLHSDIVYGCRGQLKLYNYA